MEIIRISVRDFVAFLLKAGDIDLRRGTLHEKELMQTGSRIHRKIQRRMPVTYQAEVPLSITVEKEEYQLVIEGRADGIDQKDGGFYIDEIKSTIRELTYLEHPVEVQLAQAKCYALIWGKQQNLETIGVQMTYVQMDTEEIKRFFQKFSLDELEKWFAELVAQYERWCEFLVHWKRKRNDSMQEMVFPYPYRRGQKEIAVSVYRTFLRKKRLFIQAPTGSGKTLATLFPAVKAMGEGIGEKIFYLTARTAARTVAFESARMLQEKGLQMKTVVLTAKEKLCPLEEVSCNPNDCPYAQGHYDRINDAVYELLMSDQLFSRNDIEEHAKKWRVCPFEMNLDLSLWVDMIICDYNYVFDPNARLKRYFSEGKNGKYFFLVDEAHNLVDRGREMFSAQLVKEEFLQLKKAVQKTSVTLAKQLEKCNCWMLGQKRECADFREITSLEQFPLYLQNLSEEMQKYLESVHERDVQTAALELFFSVQFFLVIYDQLDESYIIYEEYRQDGTFAVKLFCVDPSTQLMECFQKGVGTVLFSATMLPMPYYKRLLGERDDYAVYAESSFDFERQKILLAMDVSSRYDRRGRREYEKIADYILGTSRIRKGNYMVFFSSYKMLEEVAEIVREKDNGQTTLISQTNHMAESQREEFLECFQEKRAESLLAFCIMGGIFGEGIDLQKDSLIGAIIVGTGLPQICQERQLLKTYFDRRGEDGFLQAYLYPGMNKVMQAAGRVIRTEEDKGVVLLLDQRFRQDSYQDMFPREWYNREYCSLEDFEEKLEKFWN